MTSKSLSKGGRLFLLPIRKKYIVLQEFTNGQLDAQETHFRTFSCGSLL
jgi:hypothetical protein